MALQESALSDFSNHTAPTIPGDPGYPALIGVDNQGLQHCPAPTIPGDPALIGVDNEGLQHFPEPEPKLLADSRWV